MPGPWLFGRSETDYKPEAAYSGNQEVGPLPYFNAFPQCNFGGSGRPSDCGQELLKLVGPTVEAALLSFVSEYPAPQFWDAAGAATQTRQLTPTFKPQPNATNRWQWDQKVIFFAELP